MQDYSVGRFLVREYASGNLFDQWKSNDAPAVLAHACRGHFSADYFTIMDTKSPNMIEWSKASGRWEKTNRPLTAPEHALMNAQGEYQMCLGDDAESYKALILSQVQDDKLPDFARAIKAGAAPTAEFYRWLLQMWAADDGDEKDEAITIDVMPEMLNQVLESLEVDISNLEAIARGDSESELTAEEAARYASRKRSTLEFFKAHAR